MRMPRLFVKLDLRDIWKDHVSTFGDEAKSAGSVRRDKVVFFGLPIVPAVTLTALELPLNGVCGTLMTALAVLTGLLLNVLVLLFNWKKSSKKWGELGQLRGELVHELYSNISFAVFSGGTSVVALLLYSLAGSRNICSMMSRELGFWCDLPNLTATFFVHYCVWVFLVELPMILKRAHLLMARELDDS